MQNLIIKKVLDELEDTKRQLKELENELQKKEIAIATSLGKVDLLSTEIKNKVCHLIMFSQAEVFVYSQESSLTELQHTSSQEQVKLRESLATEKMLTEKTASELKQLQATFNQV